MFKAFDKLAGFGGSRHFDAGLRTRRVQLGRMASKLGSLGMFAVHRSHF
jgi:hypothetical protein